MKDYVRINMLQPSDLSKPKELEMYEVILNSIELLDVLDNVPAFFCHKLANKIISTNRYTESHKADRAKRVKGKLPTKLSQLR